MALVTASVDETDALKKSGRFNPFEWPVVDWMNQAVDFDRGNRPAPRQCLPIRRPLTFPERKFEVPPRQPWR